MIIRDETPADHASITAVIDEAFRDRPYSDGREAEIVLELRKAGALTVSLIAEAEGAIVGQVAFSPVTIGDENLRGWYGLGPVAVRNARQKQGIGSRLIKEGLARLQSLGSQGCVLAGDPAYYARFGFRHHPQLVYPGLPPEYFMALSFSGPAPQGTVRFHAAFG
jgi:putative acetyltransferase